MSTFLIYIIRWAVVLTMLYSLYGLFMKRETLHGVNRIVLLVVLVASMVLPVVQVETHEANIVTEGRELLEQQIMAISPVEARPAVQPVQEPMSPSNSNSVVLALIVIYIIGVAVAWLRYLWSLASLLLLIRQGKHIGIIGLSKGITVLTHPSITTPCSWMHWMLLPERDVQSRPIILHELSHIRLGHSWDMLLCEATCRMLWFVPFAWMLRQDLRDVHEYQADRRVLQSGIQDEEYQLLLIKKAARPLVACPARTSTGLQPVVRSNLFALPRVENAFNQSPIKRRFKMMYRKPSRRWVALKAAYLLPLSALALVAFARPQAMKEIEEQVEETAPAVVDAIKTVAQQLPSLQGKEPVVESETTPPATEVITESAQTWAESSYAELPDSNLVKADLTDNEGLVELRLNNQSCMAVLDSVMQAVGARKIANGTFIGHFQPSLNNDTVRLSHVEFIDKQSKTMAGIDFDDNKRDPYAYSLKLQAGTRKNEKGYYIRYLQPVNSAVRNYDKKQVDPKMLSIDSVLTKRSNSNMLSYYFTPIAIEQDKKETRIFMYTSFLMRPEDEARLREQNANLYENLAIVDEKTGDKYVCRATDWSYFKQVKEETVGKDTLTIYQMCLVFPPIGKRVKEAYFGHVDREEPSFPSFKLNEIPRKGRVITN